MAVSEALKRTLAERGATYAHFTAQFPISVLIKELVTSDQIENDPVLREGRDMLATKLSRVVAGDPYYPDSWLDIAGYAMLMHEHALSKQEQKDGTP